MTTKPVVPRLLAYQDVEDAVANYLEKGGERVAYRFLDALQRAYAHIGRQPGSGSLRYARELNVPGLRSRQLRRFPHLVFYVERQDHVDVWRVLHGRRDIPAWMTDPEQP